MRVNTRKSGPIPLYVTPISSVSVTIFFTVDASTNALGNFFSVASTTPSLALIPRLVAPDEIAASACLICSSSPLGENVVSENEYRPSLMSNESDARVSSFGRAWRATRRRTRRAVR